jgi:hypothetical protein
MTSQVTNATLQAVFRSDVALMCVAIDMNMNLADLFVMIEGNYHSLKKALCYDIVK